MGRDFGRRADQVFFEFLGEFTHQGDLDFAKDLADFFDELVDVMRARVENLGCFFVFQLFQQVNALGALFGREILKAEMVCGHTARNECGNHGAGARNGANVDSFAHAFANQVECRVCNAGSTGIAYQGDVAFVFQEFHILGGYLLFIEVMVGFHGRVDAVVVKEHARVACVFGKHQRDFL